MEKAVRLILIIIVLSCLEMLDVEAQSFKDFLISGEDNPSTFQHQHVRLFPFSFNHFIAAWEDNRDGDWGWYAQECDSAGGLLGKNFSILSNKIVQRTSDGSYLVLSEKMSSFFDEQSISVYGNFFGPTHQLLQSTLLGSAALPWCGTGYLGLDYDCKSTSNNYLFLFRNDGQLSLSKYQSGGTEVFRLSDSLLYGRVAYSSALAFNARNDYAIIWCRTDRTTMRDYGVYGTFLNDRDSVLALDQPLGFPFDSSKGIFSSRRSLILKSIALPDSAYLIFVPNADSGLVYFGTFDRYGSPLSDIHSLPIPRTNSQTPNVVNISLSQIVNNSFNLLVSNSEWRSTVSVMLNGLYSFNADGSSQGLTAIDSTQTFTNSDTFVKISDSTFIFGMDHGKDVYINRYRNFSLLDSLKLNDDQIGSNEDNSVVLPAGPNQFFVLWDDGFKTSGQKITFTGEKNGSPQVLEGKGIEFYSDGSSVSCWRHTASTGEDTIGYTILGTSGEMVKQGLVVTGKNLPVNSILLKIVTDSLFVVTLQENYDSAKIFLYWKNGSFVKGNEIVSTGNVYSLKISMNDDKSFWIQYGTKVRLFSNQLVPLTDEKTLNSQIHLQGNTFLSVWPEYDIISYIPTYYGSIFTFDGDTLQKKIYLVANPNGYTVGNLPDGGFLLIAGNNNSLYAQAFSKDGKREKDSIYIHSTTAGSKKNPSFALNGNKICFTWSEVRSPSWGYSIFGSIMDLTTLDVKETHGPLIPTQTKLYQNYPNPFNPITVIRYQLSTFSKVKLRIYDMLGREVVCLVNEEQSPGIKQVEWNASNISSGIYFYRLEADGENKHTVESKKMILMK
jgi:hypothetical protein